MRIKSLLLYNFRNYKAGSWQFSDGVNILYGKNGHGKTNILEAIYFSAFGSSHRTAQEDDLINISAEEMSVCTTIEKMDDVESKINVKKIGRRLKKEILLDQQKIKPRELIGQLKITIFSPEDLQLVKSEPALRRRFIDMQIAQTNSAYCFSLARYNKIIQQRNSLLAKIKENEALLPMLDAWDEQLIKEATFIFSIRMKTLTKIAALTYKNYQNISGQEDISECVYKRKENMGYNIFREDINRDHFSWYKKELTQRREKDIERANTGIGPHRDDIFFLLNDLPLKGFASQGQQRSFVLSLKMAEIQLIREESGEYPVLLLDDVLSELDSQRKSNLLEFLSGKVQTFITLTEKNLLEGFENASFYKVEDGQLTML